MWENNRDDWTKRTWSEWASIKHEQVTLLTLATDNCPCCSVEPNRYSWPTMPRRVVNHVYVPVLRHGQQMWRLYNTAGERWTYFPRVRSSKHATRVRTGVSGRLKRTGPARAASVRCSLSYHPRDSLCSLRTAGARESPIYLEYTREAIYRPAGTVKRMNGNVLKVMLCDLLIFSSDMFTLCSSALGAKRKPLHDCNFFLSD